MSKQSWIDYYIPIAFQVAKKSPDIHTKHGCVISDRSNRPLGFGFNGFPRKVDDSDLPLNRPIDDSIDAYYSSKYPWMYHAERNALANCQLRPENGIAYGTGHCCNECIYALWQHGVTELYMVDKHGSVLIANDVAKLWFNQFIKKTGMLVTYVPMNEDWAKI